MYQKKAIPFLILEILHNETDMEHYCSQKDLVRLLKERYGLQVDRKAVGANVELLNRLGVHIDKDRNKGGYRLSYCYDLRRDEIKLLIDAILSSHHIDGAVAIDLVKRLEHHLSKYERRDYHHIYKTLQIRGSNYNWLFEQLGIFLEAIRNRKMIQFSYYDYDRNGELQNKYPDHHYTVSPYQILHSDGFYYLVCNINKQEGISLMRIDMMDDVTIIEEDENHIFNPHINDARFSPNPFHYLSQHIQINQSNVIKAKIHLASTADIKDVFDYYNYRAEICYDDLDLNMEITSDEESFLHFILQNGDKYKVLSPASIIDKIKEILRKMWKDYL